MTMVNSVAVARNGLRGALPVPVALADTQHRNLRRSLCLVGLGKHLLEQSWIRCQWRK
ncbi:hypothetical protein [Rhodovarius sp.]|uniref:hypothetical protein n=1 Tax=Rhodovarius sp. TaxID=2972673 RepID=UPI00333E50A8